MSRAAALQETRDSRGKLAGAGSGSLERVTVNLTSQSSRALEIAAQLTGDTKTDTINRAVQLYAYLEQVTQDGGAIYVQESADDELTLVKIF